MRVEDLNNYTANTELEKEVIAIITNEASDYDSLEAWLSDLLNHGCVSGMVGALTYYCDTLAFASNNAEDINELLSNQLSMFGMSSPAELFGDKWDKEDNLCLDTTNRNLLAWFAFEETAREIGISFDLEVA